MAYARDLLAEAGLEADRLEMYHIGASDAPLWAEKVREMTDRVRSLGPNPIGSRREREQREEEIIEYRTENIE